MLKKVYFLKTNGYNMLVSVDRNKNCKYLTETEDFPVITGLDEKEKIKRINEFLAIVEDDTSWDSDCTYDQIFVDDIDVLAETEKEL